MNYGYQETDELVGKQGGKFGLNTGVNITKFEYNANAGSDGAAQDAIDLTVQVGEREYRHRFFPITKAWAKEGGEITDKNSPEYKDSINKQVALLNGTLTDIVKCFVGEEALKAALASPITSFKSYAEILQRLVQSVPKWQEVPVDVFLQYQWKPSGENDKTYLELPKDVKQGTFICKSLGSGFKEDRTETHLRYTKEDGTVHTFKRTEWFVKSAYANQTNLSGGDNTSASASTSMNSAGQGGW